MNKHTLRKILRQKRLSLSQREQEVAAIALKHLFCAQSEFIHSQYIAGYWPILGEISPLLILEEALRLKKKCFLPILSSQNSKTRDSNNNSLSSLSFGEYTGQEQLILNDYGIWQPSDTHKTIPVSELDMVLTPLLGFHQSGTRLGMGKGYYDRTFAFLKAGIKKPLLIGLAYDWQEIPELPREAHDVLLCAIATDKRYMVI